MKAEHKDNRLFPRTPVQCPALYCTPQSQRRRVGIVVNYSATGLKMACKEALALDTPIQVELKPGSDKSVPALIAEGVVVRCEADDNQPDSYHIACRLTHIGLPDKGGPRPLK